MVHDVEKAYHAPTCCMSQDLIYVSGFSDADEEQSTHTHNRLLANSPFYVSKGLSFFFFFFVYHLYYFFHHQASNGVFPQATSAFPAENDTAETLSGK